MDRSPAESQVLSAAATRSWNSSAHRPRETQRSLQVLGPKPELRPQAGRQEGKNSKLPGAGDRYVSTQAPPLSHALPRQAPLIKPGAFLYPLHTPVDSGCEEWEVG